MSGVTTRTQKRRMIGRRDSFLLWDLIVKCDDICFTHILPRLNRTDVKFLYGVNTETRKLIKRSSRAGDLKKKFYIGEMSITIRLAIRRWRTAHIIIIIIYITYILHTYYYTF